jgi:hypothetical protein
MVLLADLLMKFACNDPLSLDHVQYRAMKLFKIAEVQGSRKATKSIANNENSKLTQGPNNSK